MTTTEQHLATAAQLKSTVREMEARVRAWWKRDGLGHTSSVSLTGSGCMDVEVHCSPHSEIEERIYDEDPALPLPERRARVMRQFEDRGLVLTSGPGGDIVLVDCDATTAALKKIVHAVFPTAVIMSLVTQGGRNGALSLRSMTVLIRDLDEVFALPAAPADT